LNFQNVLGRKRNHIPQAQISDRRARIANAAGIFKCARQELVRGKIVILVDDVATTGSTLDDCARALKAAGAKEVIGFVFAKGTFAYDKKMLQ
jgi:predicted amidophosphoribosyltransferase